jgi:hypothetical protein
MKKTSVALLILILLWCTSTIPSNINLVKGEATFKISGYVMDSNGTGVAGAKVMFVRGTPFYPSAYTNNSGYYEVVPYTGINDVSITPPSNTNFVKFSQSSFDVESNISANFTLSLGYRLSGFVLDQNLIPIKSWSNGGVGIFLDDYWSGAWADSNGQYYVVAPAGSHTIYARQMEQVSYSGIGWSSEYEVINNTNFELDGNVAGNIIINFPNSTSPPTTGPTITPTLTEAATPTIPEFSALTISFLIILLATAGLLIIRNGQRSSEKT